MNKAKSFINRAGYTVSLKKFDCAVCEAISVNQASANRMASPNIGYASYVFAQMCGAAVSLIRAVPLTRWVHSDFEDWRFGAAAGHARALLDGFLLFNYLIAPAQSESELNARITVMHLNDCTRRLELYKNAGATEDIEGFEKQRVELQARLAENEYFNSLPSSVQKNCKNGRFLTINTRDEMLAKVGFEKGQFDAIYDLWSQHVHILPMSFYRMEANGRGTGLENDIDRSYIASALEICSELLTEATDLIVKQFPDIASVRQGVNSTFSPGPARNKPRKMTVSKAEASPVFQQSSVSLAIARAFSDEP